VLLLLILSPIVGLPWARPNHWDLKLLIAVPTGVLATVLFIWVWVGAHEAYNRAIQDSASIGDP
jgi:hypothetical protein